MKDCAMEQLSVVRKDTCKKPVYSAIILYSLLTQLALKTILKILLGFLKTAETENVFL